MTANKVGPRIGKVVGGLVVGLLCTAAVAGCGRPASGLPEGPRALGSYSGAASSPAAAGAGTRPATASPTPSPTASSTSAGSGFCLYAAKRLGALQAFPATPEDAKAVQALWAKLASQAPPAIRSHVTYLRQSVDRLAGGDGAGLDPGRIGTELTTVGTWAERFCVAN